MTGLTALTLARARDGLRQKEFSAVELARAHIDAIETARPLNAFIIETPEKALAMARNADTRIAKGDAGPLEGIPLGIKDLYCTEGVQTTAGSHILEGFVPPYESTVTANLWRDGAVMLGKLNLDEFAMGSSNETSYFGPVISPWRRGARIPRWCPAARRAARRRRSRRGFVSARRRPTPAARSASPRRLPEPPALSRPMGVARASASSPSRPRSIRRVRSRARCATRRSCCARWRAMTRKIRRPSIFRCRISRPLPGVASRA